MSNTDRAVFLWECDYQLSERFEMNESIILDDDELYVLTGRRRKSLQVKWLRENGFDCRVNAIGKPVIFRTSLINNSTTESIEQQKPDFGALINGENS